MTFITDLFIKLFSLILETVGTLASYNVCGVISMNLKFLKN